jgi:hypothetical protein
MNRMRTYFTLLFILASCANDDDSGGTTSVSGQAVYRDATTNHDGTQRAPSAPPAQSVKLTMTIKGTGETPQLDPQCLRDTGTFEAKYAGNASLDDGGAYVASFASGAVTTPSGCELPELTIGIVTDIVVRAELATTTPNCQTYCDANARADAEAQCGPSASCRETAEASGSASCMTTCTSQRTKIVAETSLGVSSLGQIDANALRTATFADLEGKLVFTTME